MVIVRLGAVGRADGIISVERPVRRCDHFGTEAVSTVQQIRHTVAPFY
jgi:hypothetical protein